MDKNFMKKQENNVTTSLPKKEDVQQPPELLWQLYFENQEAIQEYKVELEKLISDQSKLPRKIGTLMMRGMTWEGLAEAISEMPYECQMLEAVIVINNETGRCAEPLKVSIGDIEANSDHVDSKSYYVNCSGDFTTSMPCGNYL